MRELDERLIGRGADRGRCVCVCVCVCLLSEKEANIESGKQREAVGE